MRLIDPGDRTTQQRNGKEHSRNRRDRQQAEDHRLPLLPSGFGCRYRDTDHFVFFAAFFAAFFGAFLTAFAGDEPSVVLVPTAAVLPPVAFFLSPKARSQFFQNSGVVPVRTIGPLIDSASLSNRNSNHYQTHQHPRSFACLCRTAGNSDPAAALRQGTSDCSNISETVDSSNRVGAYALSVRRRKATG